MRKVISLLIVVCMVLSFVTGISVLDVANADANAIEAQIEALRATYPPDSYWTQNYYHCGKQCYGFARLLAQNIFGSHPENGCAFSNGYVDPNGWELINVPNQMTVEPGDIIQTYTSPGNEHTALVRKVEGNIIYVVECWGSQSNRIAWGYFNGNSRYSTLSGIISGYNYTAIWKHPLSSAHNPTVCVDSCVGGEGTVYLRGWAFDKDDYSLPVNVHVYVGGPDTATGIPYSIIANTYRDDVNRAHGCGDYHGFETTLDVPIYGDNVDVYVYGFNSIGGGANFLYNKYTVKITTPPPSKPEWKDMKSSYEYDEDVIFNWTNTEHTTYFDVNIYDADTGALVKYIYKIPMGYSYELPAGNYKAQVIAFNENAYENDGTTLKHTESDFCYFTVETETGNPATYTARYYIQKINGKGYVLSDQKVLDGISGETATAPVVSYDGFTENTAKGTVSGTIAPDGSLVLSRYFDRNTYSVSFEMNGGSATPEITALYGWYITAPDNPSKEGYDFGGWYADEDFEEEFVFDTMPLGGATVYAKWDLRGIEYQINGITLKSSSTYEVIDSIPDSSFLVEVSVTNVCADDTDAVILAYYKENGQYIGMQYLYTKSQAGQTMRFGASVDNTKGDIAKIKAFVLPTLGSPIPLANSAEVK